jgi:hypothetical protein
MEQVFQALSTDTAPTKDTIVFSMCVEPNRYRTPHRDSIDYFMLICIYMYNILSHTVTMKLRFHMIVWSTRIAKRSRSGF